MQILALIAASIFAYQKVRDIMVSNILWPAHDQ